jgi:DMSO/TMAO reductase YedYZ molybdopterin-dependent catalytic subunit
VVAIELIDRSIPGYWEVRGYPDSAQFKPRRVFDVNSKRWRRMKGGETTEFVD